MRLDRAASVSVAKRLIDTGALRPKIGIPILMYHSVSNDPETGTSPYYRLSTSPVRFREHMRWLREGGYTVLSLHEALRRLRAGTVDTQPSIVITFDDGFRDFLTDAWPVLAECGFTASVFLPTAYIDRDRRSFKGRPCLTWPEVRELHAEGILFGTHTVSHPTLYRLPRGELRRELIDSRTRLEAELGVSIDSFAYPYAFPQEDGIFIEHLRRELIACGYKVAATTVIGRATSQPDILFLKRIPINDCDDEPLFHAKLHGAYDWVGGLQSFVRRVKSSRTLMAQWHPWHDFRAT